MADITPTPLPRELVVAINDARLEAHTRNWVGIQLNVAERLADAGRELDSEYLLFADTVDSFRERCKSLTVRF